MLLRAGPRYALGDRPLKAIGPRAGRAGRSDSMFGFPARVAHCRGRPRRLDRIATGLPGEARERAGDQKQIGTDVGPIAQVCGQKAVQTGGEAEPAEKAPERLSHRPGEVERPPRRPHASYRSPDRTQTP
jgi:hypothetical protein